MVRMGEINPLLIQRIIAWDQVHGMPPQQEAGREKEKGEMRFSLNLQWCEAHNKPPLPSPPQPAPEAYLRKVAGLAAAQQADTAGEEERTRLVGCVLVGHSYVPIPVVFHVERGPAPPCGIQA
ncbi:hypothetical protein DXG01_016047 [Tephrocybe rancida]|nr:hypothetical protein DXG01_016047 [Tephrocybe rancida]